MNILRLKSRLLISFLGLFFVSHLFNLEAQSLDYTLPFKAEEQFKSNVYKISDAKGTPFILKRHYTPEKALYEIMGSEIGNGLVNINKVQILTPTLCLKEIGIARHDSEIFTLHSYIEGEHYEKELIFQAINKKDHLKNIADHDSSLAHIAAFNLFVNNGDCHKYNLLHNKQTNLFYLIDMDYAFEHCHWSLAAATLKYLSTIKKRKLSPEKIKALKNFNETLNHLISLYPPEKFHNLWIQKAEELNYVYDAQAKDNHLTIVNNYFNEIKNVHCHLNYLTKQPTFIEKISHNVTVASFYSFKKLNKLSHGKLYPSVLHLSKVSCEALDSALKTAQEIHNNMTKLQKKLAYA